MSCQGCRAHVESMLTGLAEVKGASVNLEQAEATLDRSQDLALRAGIRSIHMILKFQTQNQNQSLFNLRMLSTIAQCIVKGIRYIRHLATVPYAVWTWYPRLAR